MKTSIKKNYVRGAMVSLWFIKLEEESGIMHPTTRCKGINVYYVDPDLCVNKMKEQIQNHNHRDFAKITKIQ